jgi:disulfide bond formation protein DsbB
MNLVIVINKLLSYLTVIGQFYVLYIFVLNFCKKFRNNNIIKFIDDNRLYIVFIVSLVATLGSLFFSEIAGYQPCKLCWYQRIFMYPQVFIYLLAIINKKYEALRYGLMLSIIGVVVSFNHYLSQLGLINIGSCDVTGFSVACSKLFVMEFGYITIPMMAFTAFMMNISTIIFLSKRKNVKD